jgi:hypothetical protein
MFVNCDEGRTLAGAAEKLPAFRPVVGLLLGTGNVRGPHAPAFADTTLSVKGFDRIVTCTSVPTGPGVTDSLKVVSRCSKARPGTSRWSHAAGT